MALEVGSIGPDFALPDQEGNYIRLSRLLEANDGVVVYFFPQADSPGCTREACGFRDNMAAFEARRIAVVGISADKQDAQARFARGQSLNFSILADPDHTISEEWGAWRGSGVARTTFVLDKKGVITHMFPRVDVMKHATDVLALFGDAPASAPAPAPETAAAGASVASVASVPSSASDLVANVARDALHLLLHHLDHGGALPPDVADLAARVASRR